MAGTIIGVFSVLSPGEGKLGFDRYEILQSCATGDGKLKLVCKGEVSEVWASFNKQGEATIPKTTDFYCFIDIANYFPMGCEPYGDRWNLRHLLYGVKKADGSKMKLRPQDWKLIIDGETFEKEKVKLHIAAWHLRLSGSTSFAEGYWERDATLEVVLGEKDYGLCTEHWIGSDLYLDCEPTYSATTTSTTTSTVTTAPADEVHILPIDETAGDYLPLLAVLGIVMVAGLIIWRR